jgi:hypothetical protein
MALFVGACQPSAHFTSGRLNQTNEHINYVYSLPKTVIKLDFEFVRRTVIPGPYGQYARKYLSITDAATTKKSRYEIASISAKQFTEPDYKNMYYISDDHGSLDREQLFLLTEKGLILNPSLVSGYEIRQQNITRLTEQNPFTEFLIHKNIKGYSQKTFNATRADTGYNQSPYLKDNIQSQSLDAKARDVANAILRIREWRLELIGGQLDFMPEREAMDRVLQELSHIEKEYLALFTGREYYDTARTTLFFIPENKSVEEHKTLFYFSEDNGPSELYKNGSLPIEMHIFNKTDAAVASTLEKVKATDPVQDKLYYRIPGTAEFHLTFNTRQLLKERIPVYQYGVLTAVSASAKQEK